MGSLPYSSSKMTKFKSTDLIYLIIVIIASLCFSQFFFGTFTDNKTNQVLLSLSVINAIIFLLFWLGLSYIIAKITKKEFFHILKKDALSYLPFFLLLVNPLLRLSFLQQKYQAFGTLPSMILLTLSVSLFVAAKMFLTKVPKITVPAYYIYILIIVYFTSFTAITIMKHQSFHSTALDLGIYDQIVWSYSKGRVSYNTVAGIYPLGDHAEYILFLIAPFYRIYSNPITLLVIQTLFLAIAALPIYWIAKEKLNSLAAILISAAYLIYPSVQYVNLFDFHPIALSVPFVAFSLYFLLKKQYWPAFLFLFLAGLCKEHMPLLFTTYGIYLFFQKKRLMGVSSAIFGALWTYLDMYWLIPAFSKGEGYFYSSLFTGIIQSGAITFIKQLLINKLPFMVLLLIPMGFGLFVFLSPIILLGIVQLAIINVFLLTTSISEIIYQHQAGVIAFIVVGTILGLANLGRWISKKTKKIGKGSVYLAGAAFILIASFLANMSYGPFAIVYNINSFAINTEYAKSGHEILQEIPQSASVSAVDWMLPHLSEREKIYRLRYLDYSPKFYTPPKELQNISPEYLVIDLSETFKDKSRGGGDFNSSTVAFPLYDKHYGIIDVKDTWVLLQRGADYGKGLCEIKDFLDKAKYPYLDINITLEDLKTCQISAS
jgi:uncharacterized membrane protein